MNMHLFSFLLLATCWWWVVKSFAMDCIVVSNMSAVHCSFYCLITCTSIAAHTVHWTLWTVDVFVPLLLARHGAIVPGYVASVWLCLHCSQTTGLEQPPGRHSSPFITGHFQMLTQVPSFSTVFFLLSFRLTMVTLYSALEVTLYYLWHSTRWQLYITLIQECCHCSLTCA